MTIAPHSRPLVEPVFDLKRFGRAPAVMLDDRTVTYAELDARVAERVRLLGSTRRLVMIEGVNELEPIITYLAALAGGHPALLVAGTGAEAPRRQWERLLRSYDPDVTFTRDTSSWQLDEVRPGTKHALHPDLALLLGTSGSTGSPKLVRLSRVNLRANAEAIAESLDITADDRAATTLPIHYCYGLSVLNSHLTRGASLWLTDASVVDDEFWRGFDRAGATSFAGVPYTFDLLEKSGFAERELPSLRMVTQAGGAMAPDRVRAYAELGRERSFDLVVMYGQTEATARMAYLPPHLAADRAGTIGVPIPGGEMRIDGRSGTGELVFTGPNVMLGYAHSPADLALGRIVHELRTGDLARQHDDGLYEIVGRCNRVAKLFGARLDLDVVERLLAEAGVESRAVVHGDRLVVFVGRECESARVVTLVRAEHCLPGHAVQVVPVDEFPTTANGKPDYPALSRQVVDVPTPDSSPGSSLRAMYATLLGRPDATEDDSFVSLRGDSLSFVEVSYQLERKLGHLPRGWPELTISELETRENRGRRWLTRLEMPVLLRALAIVLVVGSHVELFDVMGGAHVMLAAAGYNLARFQLADVSRRERLARIGCSLRELVVPAVLWIGGVALVSGKYDLSTVLLTNTWFGPDVFTDQWHFWFLEVVLYAAAGLGALLLVRSIDRFERSRPFLMALIVTASLLVLRYALAGVESGPSERYAVPTLLWCVALGWLAARASTWPQRLLASALAIVGYAGFFGEPGREALVVVGLLMLLWIPTIPVPRVLGRLIVTLGAATYFIYLTHWVVYPPLEVDHSLLALLASLAVGIIVWRAYGLARTRVAVPWQRRTCGRGQLIAQ